MTRTLTLVGIGSAALTLSLGLTGTAAQEIHCTGMEPAGTPYCEEEASRYSVPGAPTENPLDAAEDARQQVLAEWARQNQLTAEHNQQLAAERQAAVAAQQAANYEAEEARFQALLAEQHAKMAAHRATMEGTEAGFKAGTARSRAANSRTQIRMVVDTARSWKPPKLYSTSTAGRRAQVAMVDPFAPPPEEQLADAEADLASLIAGSCLELDEERGLARISAKCAQSGCARGALAGDYPFLADGSLLDTPTRIDRFLQICEESSEPFPVLRASGEMTVVRRAG